MIDPQTVDAIVFDIGGVFLIPHPDPILACLSGAGIQVSPDDDAFHLAHYRGVRGITDAVLGGEAQADESTEAVWQAYDLGYFPALGVSEADLPAAVTARGDHRRVGSDDIWSLRIEHNIEAFHQLALGPRPLAIVSNNDGSAPEEMKAHGICQLGAGPLPEVVALVDSTLIGVAKPNPAIFGPVMQALPDIDPGHMLYVGDTVHADVRGATNAGMQVVQLDPHDLHRHLDHERLSDVVELVELLG